LTPLGPRRGGDREADGPDDVRDVIRYLCRLEEPDYCEFGSRFVSRARAGTA